MCLGCDYKKKEDKNQMFNLCGRGGATKFWVWDYFLWDALIYGVLNGNADWDEL